MRRGFTLIEMLVSTALVMLIMILFAEIFSEAVSTVRAQRAIIANDEKARAFITTLGTDLSRRTYRTSVGRGSLVTSLGILESPQGLVALGPGDRVDPRQRGYFYYSENDPNDDGDDVLAFTVSVEETLRNPLVSDPSLALFTGRALDANLLPGSLNQPDLDDGRADRASASRAAEVCYFLRGTTLYRRVMLLRDPLPNASPPFGTQPTLASGSPALSSVPNVIVPGALQYRDFDFAATNVNGFLHFHGLESLDNARGLANSPIALPGFRFGHLPNGLPREFDNATPLPNFFGRFNQEETSFEGPNGLPPGLNGFRWPGVNDGAGNNIIDSPLVTGPAGVLAVDVNTDNAFDGGDVVLSGSRAGEDILMTGVETFNVQVWDPGYGEADFDGSGAWDPLNPTDDLNMNGVQDNGAWVDIGNQTGSGLFTQNWVDRTASGALGNVTWGRQNVAYGPGGPAGNHVFDTWHPDLGPTLGVAPYRPLQVAPAVGVTWAPNSVPGVTAIIFPDAPTSNFSIGYVAINADGFAQTGSRQPEWPREPGAIVRDGGVLWQCFDNRIGLEKIRVTIRFRDPGSSQARQVSLVHAFTE